MATPDMLRDDVDDDDEVDTHRADASSTSSEQVRYAPRPSCTNHQKEESPARPPSARPPRHQEEAEDNASSSFPSPQQGGAHSMAQKKTLSSRTSMYGTYPSWVPKRPSARSDVAIDATETHSLPVDSDLERVLVSRDDDNYVAWVASATCRATAQTAAPWTICEIWRGRGRVPVSERWSRSRCHARDASLAPTTPTSSRLRRTRTRHHSSYAAENDEEVVTTSPKTARTEATVAFALDDDDDDDDDEKEYNQGGERRRRRAKSLGSHSTKAEGTVAISLRLSIYESSRACFATMRAPRGHACARCLTHPVAAMMRHASTTTFAPGIALVGRVWLLGKAEMVDIPTAELSTYARARHAAVAGLATAVAIPLAISGGGDHCDLDRFQCCRRRREQQPRTVAVVVCYFRDRLMDSSRGDLARRTVAAMLRGARAAVARGGPGDPFAVGTHPVRVAPSPVSVAPAAAGTTTTEQHPPCSSPGSSSPPQAETSQKSVEESQPPTDSGKSFAEKIWGGLSALRLRVGPTQVVIEEPPTDEDVVVKTDRCPQPPPPSARRSSSTSSSTSTASEPAVSDAVNNTAAPAGGDEDDARTVDLSRDSQRSSSSSSSGRRRRVAWDATGHVQRAPVRWSDRASSSSSSGRRRRRGSVGFIASADKARDDDDDDATKTFSGDGVVVAEASLEDDDFDEIDAEHDDDDDDADNDDDSAATSNAPRTPQERAVDARLAAKLGTQRARRTPAAFHPCPVCFATIERAVRINACAHAACAECLSRWNILSTTCPACGGFVDDIRPDRALDRIIALGRRRRIGASVGLDDDDIALYSAAAARALFVETTTTTTTNRGGPMRRVGLAAQPSSE